MKVLLIAAIIIFLPFGVLMLSIPVIIRAKIEKVDENWRPDYAVIFWALFWAELKHVPFDLVLAILYNEGASQARMLKDNEREALHLDPTLSNVGYPPGDMGISRGPSVGPGQVLRTNVERLWTTLDPIRRYIYTAPTPYHLALKGYERQALWACVSIIKENLDDVGGDKQQAAQRYNGGTGNDPRAVAYGEKAAASIERIAT